MCRATRQARGFIRRFQASRANGEYVDPFNVALVHVGLATTTRHWPSWCAVRAKVRAELIMAPEPFFDPLRDDARFGQVLRRLDLRQLTAIGM
jgi:hypothetical protein